MPSQDMAEVPCVGGPHDGEIVLQYRSFPAALMRFPSGAWYRLDRGDSPDSLQWIYRFVQQEADQLDLFSEV